MHCRRKRSPKPDELTQEVKFLRSPFPQDTRPKYYEGDRVRSYGVRDESKEITPKIKTKSKESRQPSRFVPALTVLTSVITLGFAAAAYAQYTGVWEFVKIFP